MVQASSGIINFTYFESVLLDKVRQHVGMVVKLLPDAEKYYPTSDDLDFFQREMYKAFVLAYSPIHKLSPGNIADVQRRTYGGSTPGAMYSLTITDLYGHRVTALTLIDSFIETTVISLFLKEWWLKCGLADQYKLSVNDVIINMSVLNNAYYALYKPSFTPAPVWSSEDVTVIVTEDETGNTTTTVTTTGTPTTVGATVVDTTGELYFDNRVDFPAIGTVDIIYIARITRLMYKWDTATSNYLLYNGVAGEYAVNYVNENSKVVQHNLGKMSPNVVATDSDGNTFEPLYIPTDANSGTVSWLTVGSGILRFN